MARPTEVPPRLERKKELRDAAKNAKARKARRPMAIPIFNAYNIFRALLLVVGAVMASYASQLSLSPVYGGVPAPLYHKSVCEAIFVAAILSKVLFRRKIRRPLVWLTIIAYYTPALQQY